jgi:ferric-dicitrate binding protein FerR (iron transport regulator)
MAWKTHKLVFKETQLSEVVNTLNRVYNVNISIDGKDIADLKYNGTIESISLQSVLEALQTAFNLKIENQGKNIIIQKNS